MCENYADNNEKRDERNKKEKRKRRKEKETSQEGMNFTHIEQITTIHKTETRRVHVPQTWSRHHRQGRHRLKEEVATVGHKGEGVGRGGDMNVDDEDGMDVEGEMDGEGERDVEVEKGVDGEGVMWIVVCGVVG